MLIGGDGVIELRQFEGAFPKAPPGEPELRLGFDNALQGDAGLRCVPALEVNQRYINFWSASSTDLFGAEVSSNSANFFAAGLKGRAMEDKYTDHLATEGVYAHERWMDGRLVKTETPLRNAMNEVLRDAYVEDDDRGVKKWNRVLEKAGIDFRFRLPDRKFHRHIGIYSSHRFDPDGNLLTLEECEKKKHQWIPGASDREYVQSLMHPVYETGKIANWIAPPRVGINKHPFAWEYVRL